MVWLNLLLVYLVHLQLWYAAHNKINLFSFLRVMLNRLVCIQRLRICAVSCIDLQLHDNTNTGSKNGSCSSISQYYTLAECKIRNRNTLLGHLEMASGLHVPRGQPIEFRQLWLSSLKFLFWTLARGASFRIGSSFF